MQTPADTTSSGTAPALPRKIRRVNPVFLTAMVLGVIVAIGAVFWWMWANGREETDDAYIDGHITVVSPRISGNVTAVMVEENQPVKTGTLLITLDARDQQAQINEYLALIEQAKHQSDAAQSKIKQSSLAAQGEASQARGDISSVQADIAAARAGVLQAQDQVHEAESKLREQVSQEQFARSDFQRYKEVYANRAVTKQQYDKAEKSLEVAVAQREQAEQNVGQAKKQQLQAESKVLEASGRLRKSQGMLTSAQASALQQQTDADQYLSALSSIKRYSAQLNQAQLQLSYTKIYAPVDGRVGKRSVEVGQRVEPGQALMSVVQDSTWVDANFKETQVGRMRVGQPVEIKIDAFPGHTFTGKVESLGPASGAKFSMLPADNATGNFTKIVQRIPIRIHFDPDSIASYKNRIAPGMSCVVNVLVQ